VKKLLVVLVVLLVAAAFVAGYWPERQRLVQAQAEATELRSQLAEARSQLAEAEAKGRLGRLFGQFLALQDAVSTGNYGEAQTLSSAFFDRVRDEEGRADASVRAALDAVMLRRDAVTAGLARGEGSVREVLVPVERELRRALGYPVPSLAPVPAAAPEARP
jgi:type II secretory pathway pseudopilin PulG